ncbi:GNAT family N-acetyltransferase [Yoonia sp.]|uniref:GNAT family N-acetyltransferase n=1 Tax=Yoonia sp. TaxID=2212373 RepID=UPI0025CBC901|nr:GNAT family N-acetyltransferase [Yoonia sp.]
MASAICIPLQQHPHFAAALRLLGRDVAMTDACGAAPVLTIKRFGLKFAPRGPIWDGATTHDAQTVTLRQLGLGMINSDATGGPVLRWAGFRQVMTPAHVSELCLAGTSDDRLRNAHGKWRNVWRKAQQAPLRISQTVFDPDRHGWLLRADLAQQRTKRYRALPHRIIHAYAAANPRDVIVLVAKQRQATVAAMLFLCHAPVATYHIGWTNAEGRQHAAHHRLLLHAADTFAASGLLRLDLGTVDTENARGLARFKIGSGAMTRALGGTWIKIPRL